jgi:hypothetical protein
MLTCSYQEQATTVGDNGELRDYLGTSTEHWLCCSPALCLWSNCEYLQERNYLMSSVYGIRLFRKAVDDSSADSAEASMKRAWKSRGNLPSRRTSHHDAGSN